MADSLRILLGIATVAPDRRFLANLPAFASDVARYLPHVDIDYVTGWVWNKELVEAQNELADKALEGKYDYLLFMEDDHWGFTWQMLDTCLKANTHAAGIPYRSRHFPFDVVPMKKATIPRPGEIRRFKGMNDPEKYKSYHECDLLGFGFTLVKTETFRIIDRPFFMENIRKYPGCGARATDILFAESLQAKGINPVGCFQHRINHREIQEDNYKKLMVEGVINKCSLFGTLESTGKFQTIQAEWERNKRENAKLKEKSDARN
jgi:hypothetical protein